ncbi:VOC family protein [Caenibius sp. WL]|uniref:VOC family protein n=1 Tax=Caenibius sp. WL TaxID=2872646 RepID=UPI001C99F02C|nr:VOC family protein [Caenibius sp. WL]QZP07699.1 VOC family protein [Caenibius sp. WL]
MGLKGVNRIMIAVHDLERSKKLYEELLGATFLDANWTGEPFGIHVAIAWDAGIELCAPMPGRERDSVISGFLATRGEGIMSVFFGVSDGEAALERSAAAGYTCSHTLDYTQAEIDEHLGGLFSRYQEFNIDTGQRCGFAVSLARIEEKASQMA